MSAARGAGDALLELQDLARHFGGVAATDGVSLAVRAGEILALIGPNGAGKTTLVAQISGLLAPDAGRILFEGTDITRLPAHARVRLGLARAFQITSIFRGFTVLENLAFAVQARSGTSLSFWRAAASEAVLRDEAQHYAQRVGLAGSESRIAGALAHGEQRQLEVGLALATRPKLVLLDEPMAGLGPEESARMIELIESLRAKTTVLLVEHDMDAVFRLADRIAVLVRGRVIADDAPAAIRSHPEVIRAYLGEEADS
jgi:branched-chain amino acid transport system ATP-binding protein